MNYGHYPSNNAHYPGHQTAHYPGNHGQYGTSIDRKLAQEVHKEADRDDNNKVSYQDLKDLQHKYNALSYGGYQDPELHEKREALDVLMNNFSTFANAKHKNCTISKSEIKKVADEDDENDDITTYDLKKGYKPPEKDCNHYDNPYPSPYPQHDDGYCGTVSTPPPYGGPYGGNPYGNTPSYGGYQTQAYGGSPTPYGGSHYGSSTPSYGGYQPASYGGGASSYGNSYSYGGYQTPASSSPYGMYNPHAHGHGDH